MTSDISPGFYAAHFDIPAEQSFFLPDGKTNITSNQLDDSVLQIQTANGTDVRFTKQSRTLRVSPPGIVNDDRAESSAVLLLSSPKVSALGKDELWAIIYALWIRNYEQDVLPVTISPDSVLDADDLFTYLIQTGLAFSPGDRDLLLIRGTFWQGAGIPCAYAWLRSPVPSPELSALYPSVFPFHTSFTRATNVATTHPLRPPKPAPGSVIYSRYIFSLNEQLTFTHINANDPRHFETYCRWQNSDRVNIGWRERGDDEHHRAYLAERLADMHSMGFIVEWNGEMAGYGEIVWVKEDHLGTFVGGLGNYDQGTHLLIGEEKFRGRHRFTAIMTSMKHMAFLRDPRTDIVVGEPRADLPIIPRLIRFLPQEFNREVELPHKRAVFFVMRRERFFQAAILF